MLASSPILKRRWSSPVVDVGVGEKDGVNVFGAESPVIGELIAGALIQSTVDEVSSRFGIDLT